MLFGKRSGVVLGLVTVLALAPSAAMATDLVQATTNGNLYLLASGQMAWLAAPGAEEQTLDLPTGARIYDLAPTIDGWVAVGSLPSDDGYDLLVLLDREGERRLLAPPSDRRGRYRLQADALVREGNLAGIAWVEGDSQEDFEVRAAVWDGANFGSPEVVSPAGPGARVDGTARGLLQPGSRPRRAGAR